MKIEKGKIYRTRDGRKVEILKTDLKNRYPIIGAITHSEDHERVCSWNDNGMYLKSANNNNYDIVGEWEEPLDFDPYCLPKWTDQWIAMDANEKWYSYNTKPTLEEVYQMWGAELRFEGDSTEIPEGFCPKNYSGNWRDSLFNVEQLKNK